MPYLVDGHNLIPKAGMSLNAPDDEMDLVTALQEFSRLAQRSVDVYFDGAPPGSGTTRRIGRVTAHFVRIGSSADAAIQARLKNLAGDARNWIVVSSDREVQAAAREAGARSLPSEDFAVLLKRSRRQEGSAGSKKGAPQEGGLSKQEVEEWLRLFQRPR
jgi:predicted RNA-binding protein with PIN domain